MYNDNETYSVNTKDANVLLHEYTFPNSTEISKIEFYIERGSAIKTLNAKIQYKTEKSGYQDFGSSFATDKDGKTHSISLSGDAVFATGIKVIITTSATSKRDWKISKFNAYYGTTLATNVSTFSITDTKIDGSKTGSFNVTYSNMENQTLTVASSNPNEFVTSNVALDCSGTKSVTITYKPTCEHHETSATITISANGKSATVTANASWSLNDGQEVNWRSLTDAEKKMQKGATLNISNYASAEYSNDEGAVYYTSNNTSVISVGADGHTLTAVSVGTAKITAHVGNGCKYFGAASSEIEFAVFDKGTPKFTPSWDNPTTTKALKVGDKVTLTVENVSDGLLGNFKAKDYDSNILNVTRNGNTITIEAFNEGSSSVTFAQTETDAIFADSQTYSFNVSKITNTLTADATHSMKVDETWNGVISGKNSDATVTTTTSDETVAYYDVANNKIVAQNTGNQSFDSKEVTITIHQDETYKFTAVNKTITVTVNKWDNTLAWTGPSSMVWWSEQASVQASGNSDAAISCSVVDERYGSYDAVKHILYSHNKDGQLQVTATQTETYKYKGTSVTLTVNVSKANDHVEFTLNESLCNAMRTSDKSGSYAWDDGIRLGEPIGGGFNYDDKYVVIKFSGIPDKLSCSFSGGSTGLVYQVYQSADGSNWGSAVIDETKAGSANKQLAPTTRYLKFLYSGNFAGTFSDIKVTELRTFSTDKSELDFGSTNKKDMPCADQTFTFNYANVGHKVTLSTNDNHFSVSPTSITNIGGEKYGSQTIIVSYRTDEVHSATNAKLIIKDELGNSKEVTLKGTTTKKAQTLEWEKPYDVEEPAIPIGKTITGVATASSNLGVIYESSDETIIEIVNDGKAFKALTTGSATITAKQVGTEDWEEASISKTFKGTNKIIQVISWNQNFTRLLTNYGTQSLTAIVNLENAETGEQAYSKERSDLITYTSQNTSVVSVNGSTLTIVGKGETTLTATVPGDDLYESATVTIPVKVREPSAGCEDEMLGNDFGSGEYEFFHYSLTSDMEKVVKIDHSTPAIPGMLSFQHKGKKWGLNYSGEIVVYESTNNGSSWNKLGEVTPSEGTYNTQTYPLSRNATHIRFFRDKSATGYHYIKNVEISPAQFIESNAVNNTIDFGNVTVNSLEDRSVTLSYANVKDALSITKSSDNLALSCGDIIDLDCGATGTNTFTITFIPTAVGDFSDEILFYDKNSSKNYTLNIKAKVVRSTQHITWEPTQTEYRTIDQIELNATTSSSYPVKYYVKDGTDVADFVNGKLTIKKDGQITIRAYEPGDAIYEAAVDVDKTFTIRKTNLHFDPLPTAATITYPQILSESALTDGVVKDEDGNAVAGTIAWANPATQLNAGENQSQGITFTPAANPARYNALFSSVSVTVQKKESDAHAHAGEIIYGAVVGTSILTNEGTTAGTWTWTDEKKDQVLEVGTHEGLKVHFTPTDKTNYNEIDGTVSLTVKKAAATLTWTSAPTSADVKEKLTYTATSNHSESAITYAITSGADCATIDANTGELTITKAGEITVQASQDATTHYEAAEITVTTTLTGEFENVFSGEGDWNDPENWTYGVPTSDNPDVVISGNMTIGQSISVGSLTIEAGGSVTIVVEGDLTVNGRSKDRETYGNLFVRNGGDVTISENANVKVFDFVVESSIGTQNGTSVSGQVKHSDRVIYTNGAYIDINMDPSGKMDDTQWYGFTVPFPVDVQNGVARKEGDIFRKCTYGSDYMIAEYDMNQRLSTGKGWKYIKSGKLQPGQFYYITVNGDYNVYSFKAAENTITINNTTELKVNGEGADANWNAVGNSTLTYTTISGEKVPAYVQTYVNGESRYITVATDDAQFVVGCPFFFQASEEATMILNEANGTVDAHYAPRQESLDKPVCVRIAEEGKHFSDQIYLTASQEATSEYTLGRDLAKAGIGTKSAQLWMNAYGQKLSVQDATLMGDQAYYELSIYAPKAGSYELSLPKVSANAVIYLTQNGYPIWNLNETPYVIECYKGTTNEYGLLLRLQEGGSPTDMQTMRGSEKVQKIMKDQRIYINANTQLYDLMGQKVK